MHERGLALGGYFVNMVALNGIVLLLHLCGVHENPQQHSDTSRSEVVWSPARPLQGSITLVTVRPRAGAWMVDGPVVVSGYLGGRSMHFDRGTDGAFHSLAGIPVNAPDSILIDLEIEDGVWTERLRSYLYVTRGSFSSTLLSVDPRFTTPPDSALQARLAAEQEAVQEVLRRSDRTPRLFDAQFLRPRSTRVTAEFGERREFNGQLRSRHLGTDLAGDVGAPVIATNRGVVALVGDFYYAGRLVYVDHGVGLLTAYLHLSEIFVVPGDTVARGQLLGRVGASGRVTGPHLHWIARSGVVMVDPMSLLELDLDAWLGSTEP